MDEIILKKPKNCDECPFRHEGERYNYCWLDKTYIFGTDFEYTPSHCKWDKIKLIQSNNATR